MSQYGTMGPLDSQVQTDGDSAFVRFNSRLRPDQLEDGELAYSQNGRMGIDGSWQPRPGIDSFGSQIGTSSEALILPFYLYATRNISSATRSTTTVTVTTSSAHGFTTATQVGIAGLTGTFDPNGNRTITVTGTDTFTFTITGATGSETYSGSGTAGAGFLSSSVNGCYGSCLYSDPSDDNSEYFILANNASAKAVNRSNGAETTISYPTGITISSAVEMIQAFDKIYIFRDGATALVWDGVLTGSPAFAKVANGDYTQPKLFTAAGNTVASAGVVTVTETSHGLSVGDRVTIFDNASTGLVVGDVYQVASVPTSGTFTFYASVDDFSATSIVLGRKQSSGRGFVHMPAPAWAVYHQRRLIVPYSYTSTGTSGSEVITSRDVSDELLFSDILDGDTYDVLQNDFRITAGTADYLQTIHPFTSDSAIAFNRNSLHLINGLSGDLNELTIQEITRESGLVARKSVVTIGSDVFFLSDNGVYAASFGDLYNLRGAGLPLSAPIDSLIKRINSAYAYKAVGVFHDNRYWLAIPLDDSTNNNAILIYNLINKGWESIDIIDQEGWDISNFIVSGNGSINKLFAVNSLGGLHIIDERNDNVDNLFLFPGAASLSYLVDSYMKTRLYNGKSIVRKNFKNFELQLESSEYNASDVQIAVETENFDNQLSLGLMSSFLGSTLSVGEDASIRGRVGGVRGYAIQFTLTPTVGRPKIRALSVDSSIASRSLNQAS